MRKGFTLPELLITMTIVVIIAGAALVFTNPAGKLARSRNARRHADVQTIMNALAQRIADNRGNFSCVSGALPASSTRMKSGAGGYDISQCLIPAYLSALPFDPGVSGAKFATTTDYDTAYSIARSATTGRITIEVIYPELGESISVTR
jgi:prepilin-type N-terminal cleavage/methylation domain-containing protein